MKSPKHPAAMACSFIAKLVLLFIGIMSGIDVLAEFSEPLERAKAAMFGKPLALPLVFAAFLVICCVPKVVSWKLRGDLARLRRENAKANRKGKRK